jgi:hypothetical protein
MPTDTAAPYRSLIVLVDKLDLISAALGASWNVHAEEVATISIAHERSSDQAEIVH